MRTSNAHRPDYDRGFTLIELMVVVLIIAILLAIAIPTFLGAQNKAKDRSAQSSLRNAATNAKSLFADTGSYATAGGNATGVVLLQASEPALTFKTGDLPSLKPSQVSVGISTPTTWWAAVWSEAGNCFFIRDSVDPTMAGTKYAKSATITTSGACLGSSAVALSPTTLYLDKW